MDEIMINDVEINYKGNVVKIRFAREFNERNFIYRSILGYIVGPLSKRTILLNLINSERITLKRLA